MTLQIIILNTSNQPNGDFSVSGVFWLVAPANLIIPKPSFKSQVPNVTSADLSSLQGGALLEVPFHTGLYNSDTSLSAVQSDLQTQYNAAQTNLNNSASSFSSFVGAAYDGYSWSVPSAPLNIQATPMVWSGVPITTDGRPQLAPMAFPTWTTLYFTGVGDDLINGIGQGIPFRVSSEAAGQTPVSWSFNDSCYILGAVLYFTGAQLGDWVDYIVQAPATETGTGSQSVILQSVGPGNIIVPVASDGYTIIDTTKAIPVINTTNSGFWDYSDPNTGVGTITPNYSQTGNCDLFDFSLPLGHLAIQIPIIGDNRSQEIMVESVTSMKLWPQWQHMVTVNNSGHTGLRIGWCLASARARTI
jgi:hypothetical protein